MPPKKSNNDQPARAPRPSRDGSRSVAPVVNGSSATASSKKRKSRVGDATESALEARVAKLAKREPDQGKKQHEAKVAPAKKGRPARAEATRPAPLPAINKVPTERLQIMAFGSGECGELGLGPKLQEKPRPFANPFLDGNAPGAFHITQLDLGGMHTIALTDDNKIVTWGVNDRGPLGRDTTWDGGLRDVDAESDDDDEQLNPVESTPTQVPAGSFPPGTVFVQVAAGDSCSFALTDTGLVCGWGTFLDAEAKPRFFFTGDKLVEQTSFKVACGSNHALALDQAGDVWAWGVNQKNQLGYRLFESRQYDQRLLEGFQPQRVNLRHNKASYIASGVDHSFAIDRKVAVWAWGLNRYGQAGYAKDAGSDNVCLPYPMKIPDLAKVGVTALSGGADHSAAVTAEGQCLVWGRIDGGQLGVELTAEQLEDETLTRLDDRGRPRICLRPIPVTNIGMAVHVSCATGHTIFVNTRGEAFGSGFGSMGQLGIASEDDTNVAVRITGGAAKNKQLIWCGTGGQISMVAARADSAS
ncbi:Uu.00g117520.m01.CDS01 [Anthostomella pinea]|uniref:Uu.00g117520.m01.CDS01 n=1 Tax=Anthostomella pinea TaxID=933095 RepID=A0AAI8VG51_9PEZI|nr:Uu.00g117520.m01.CDS01 [Anthostomella pinea]